MELPHVRRDMTRCTSVHLCASYSLQTRCGRQALLPRAAARSPQPIMVAEAGGRGGMRQRPRRDEVTFLTPDGQTLQFKNVTQRSLQNVISAYGAAGFKAADGICSGEVEDLPEGGIVELVLPSKPRGAAQLDNLQQAADNATRAKEFQLERCLRTLAVTENPGASTCALRTTPFNDIDGQDYVQLDAAIRAGEVLYVGEFKAVLTAAGVDDLMTKLDKIRKARKGESPDLAAALQGVTHAKMFVCGDVVRRGMTVQQMAELAAAQGVGVVLLSGQALGLAGGTPPAMEL